MFSINERAEREKVVFAQIDSLIYSDADNILGLPHALKFAQMTLDSYMGTDGDNIMEIFILNKSRQTLLFLRTLDLLDFHLRGQGSKCRFEIVSLLNKRYGKLTLPIEYLDRAYAISKNFGLIFRPGSPIDDTDFEYLRKEFYLWNTFTIFNPE